MVFGCPMGMACEKVLGKERPFFASWLGLGDIKLEIKGGWAGAPMQGCFMQGHKIMAGGGHTLEWCISPLVVLAFGPQKQGHFAGLAVGRYWVLLLSQ